MNFQRDHAAELAQIKMGLRQMETYTLTTSRVHYVINHDVMHDHWTASYKVHPYKDRPIFIIVGGTVKGQLHVYPSRAHAEAACRITHRELRKGLN